MKLRKRRQGDGEYVGDYYYDIGDMCRLVDPMMTEEERLTFPL